LRIFVLLTSMVLLAAPVAAQKLELSPVLQATVRLESGLLVQVEDASIVVREGDAVSFRGTLGAWHPVTEQIVDVSVPTARAFTWHYPHLEDMVFVDLRVEAEETHIPAFTVDPTFEHRRRMVRPHDGSSNHGPVSVDTWQREDEKGYTAIVRLDRVPATYRGDSSWSFDAPAENGALIWPMAVVRASTAGELEARIGQGLLAFDGVGSRRDAEDRWRIPTLCGLCQQQQVTEVELDLQDRDSALLLRVRTRVEHEGHAWSVAEGMQIEGHTLRPWLSGQQGDEAWFVVPFEEPLAVALVAVAVSGDARVQAKLSSGRECEVTTVRVLLDPAFEERIYEAQRPQEELQWPNHLSSNLVSSWPNPFRESTTIEITVPSSIEEAFDLEPELLARVQPEAEPPFGLSPSVQVKVYNVSGQLVNLLDSGPRSAGRFTVGWNGHDLQGQPVASGAYYIHVAMEEWSVTRRVLLLRN
jgi:hypothetical protein